MGGIIGSCVGSCFGACCCAGLSQCTSAKSGPASRIPYIFLMVLSSIVALFMSLYGQKTFNLYVKQVSLCGGHCAGNSSVYRISFGLTIFEFLHVIIIGAGANAFHYSFFAIKAVLYIAGVVGLFFIQDYNFFLGWAQVARVLSAFFLIIQIMILITWAYDVSDQMVDKAENSENGNALFWMLACASLTMFIASIVLVVFFYIWYGGLGCIRNQAIISVTLFLGILGNIGLSVWAPKGSIFTSGIVALYTTYLAYAALQADSSSCNPFFKYSKTTLSIWIGIFLTLGSLCYMGWTSDNMNHLRNKDSMEEPLMSNDDDLDIEANDDDPTRVTQKEAVNNEEDEKSDDSAENRRNNMYFHIVMTLAASYLAMLFTNWATTNVDGTTKGVGSFWANVAAQWITVILYYWTLIAQKVAPERFGIENE